VKYLIMINSNPASQHLWEAFTDAQRAEGLAAYAALTADLTASGELVVSEALADPSLTRRVAVREGRTMTSDGPFAEAKEHLAGFYLVECDSMDRAIEIAGRVPEAFLGMIDVRPVLDRSGMENRPE
jgi:hypothetical protein